MVTNIFSLFCQIYWKEHLVRRLIKAPSVNFFSIFSFFFFFSLSNKHLRRGTIKWETPQASATSFKSAYAQFAFVQCVNIGRYYLRAYSQEKFEYVNIFWMNINFTGFSNNISNFQVNGKGKILQMKHKFQI